MAQFAFFGASGIGGSNAVGATPIYGPVGGSALSLSQQVAEANVQLLWEFSGLTLDRFYLQITSNGVGSSTPYTLRQNTADTAVSISVTASTTGQFTDLTHTLTPTVGDLLDISGTPPSTTLPFTESHGFRVSGTTVGVPLIASSGAGFSMTAASATRYAALAGWNTAQTAEANVQFNNLESSTLSKLQAVISVNARTTTTSYATRKNGIDGNGALSVTSSTTGSFTDLTHSDAASSGDLLNIRSTTGTGSGTVTAITTGVDYVSSSPSTGAMHSAGALGATSTSTARYGQFNGTTANAAGSGAAAGVVPAGGQFSGLYAVAATNASVTAGSATFFQNGVNGSESVSLTGMTTGLFQDVTDSDSASAGDTVGVTFSATTVGTITFASFGVLALAQQNASVSVAPGSLTATGRAETVAGSSAASAARGTATFIGPAPTSQVSVSPVPATALLAATGRTPALAINSAASPARGLLAATGPAPSIGLGINVTTGALGLSGGTPSLTATSTPAPSAGGLLASGIAPTMAFSLNPATGMITVTGQAPTTGVTAAVAPGTGALTMSGVSVVIPVSYAASPSTGMITAAGIAGAYTITGAPLGGEGLMSMTGRTPLVVANSNTGNQLGWIGSSTNSTAATFSASTTYYFPMINGTTPSSNVSGAVSATEIAVAWGGATTISRATLRISFNTLADVTSWAARQNATTMAMGFNVPAATTGVFQDLTHSLTVAQGDLLSWKMAIGPTGTGALGLAGWSALTSTAGPASAMVGSFQAATNATTTATRFTSLAGNGTLTTTEVNVTIYATEVATFTAFQAYVPANSRNSTSTVAFRNNGANGNGALSIPSSTGGLFQDLTDNDVVASGNGYAAAVVTATGTGTLTLSMVAAMYASGQPNTTPLLASAVGGDISNSSAFFRGGPIGDSWANVTENNSGLWPVPNGAIVSNYMVSIVTNASTVPVTWQLKKNATTLLNGAVSVPASTTGVFTDAADSDTMANGDRLSAVSGATSGTTQFAGSESLLALSSISVTATGTPGALAMTGVPPALTVNSAASPGAGALTLVGVAGVTEADAARAPGFGTLTMAGATPSIRADGAVAPTAGALVLLGQAPSAGLGVNPGAGALLATGRAALIGASSSAAPGAAVGTFGGQTPVMAASANPGPTAGAVAFAGVAVTVEVDTTANPNAGVLAMTGLIPLVVYSVPTFTGTLGMIGNPPTIELDATAAPLSGSVAFFDFPPPPPVVEADSAAFPRTGAANFVITPAPVVFAGIMVIASPATIGITGQAPFLGSVPVTAPTTGLMLTASAGQIMVSATSLESPGAGGAGMTGKAAAVWLTQNPPGSTGAAGMRGQTPGLTISSGPQPSAGVAGFSGAVPPVVSVSSNSSPATGAVAASGASGATEADVARSPVSAALGAAGGPVSLNLTQNPAPAVGPLVITGRAPLVQASSASAPATGGMGVSGDNVVPLFPLQRPAPSTGVLGMTGRAPGGVTPRTTAGLATFTGRVPKITGNRPPRRYAGIRR